MRKTVLAVILAASIPVMGATAACNSAWWQNFESNPVANVQAFESGVQIVLSDVQIAWGVALPFIPASAVAQVTTQYNNAVFAVNHALTLLNDAVNAAVVAQTSNPNFTALMADVTNAIAQVVAVVDQYTTNAPIVADGGAPMAAAAVASGKAPYTPALADAHAILGNLKKQYGPKTVAPAASH